MAAAAGRGHRDVPRSPAGVAVVSHRVAVSGFHTRPFPRTPCSCLRPLVTSCVDSRTAPSGRFHPPGSSKTQTRLTVTLTQRAQATAPGPAEALAHHRAPRGGLPTPGGSVCGCVGHRSAPARKALSRIHQASPWPSFKTLPRCSNLLQPAPQTALQLNDGPSSAFSGRQSSLCSSR